MSTVKLSRRDERMLSKRARSQPLSEPCYDLELVPNAADARLAEASCVAYVDDRDVWKAQLTELLLLCNEAAWRSAKRHDPAALGLPPPAACAEAKPLVLEYILDRLDTDDPLWGYQLRTREEGWLQGFVTFTTFTTWQTYFRWDSLDPRAGITLDDCDAHVVDEDGSLAADLDQCGRIGDPDGCGVIWPRVAEITLLGGLGCGSHLLQLVLDHLTSLGEYDFVVLQATDNAVPFYERHGFLRVGAVAAHHAKAPVEEGDKEGKDEKPASKHTPSKAPPKATPPKRAKSPKPAGKDKPLSDTEALALARDAAELLAAPAQPPKFKTSDERSARRVEGARLWWANRALHSLVKALSARPTAPHFFEPVYGYLPYYRDFVSEPMDLSTMAAGACAGLYDGRLLAMMADARRLEIAAVAYNGKRSKDPVAREVCQHASRLSKEAETLCRAWQATFPKWIFHGDHLEAEMPEGDEAAVEAMAAAVAAAVSAAMALPSARERGCARGTFARATGSAQTNDERRAAAKVAAVTAAAAAAEASAGEGKEDGKEEEEMEGEKEEELLPVLEEGELLPVSVAARDTEYGEAAAADEGVLGYSHWTFADQHTLDQFPSYMMARRLAPLGEDGSLPSSATEAASAQSAARKAHAANGGPPSALRARLADHPRGVVPRGGKVVGKLVSSSGGSPEYFGPCENEAEAAELYTHARGQLLAREKAANDEIVTGSAPEPAAKPVVPPAARKHRPRLWTLRDTILVDQPTPPRPERAGGIRSVPEPPPSKPPISLKPARESSGGLKEEGLKEHDVEEENGVCNDIEGAASTSVTVSNTVTDTVTVTHAGTSNGIGLKRGSSSLQLENKRLYNAVVSVSDLPPAYAEFQYWFVLQFVPDMQWCHIVPLRSYGNFPERNHVRKQRPIWKLAPEGVVRELDVPASRCTPVKASLVARTSDADKEVWDILDSTAYATPQEPAVPRKKAKTAA